jgi:DNA polymerase V
MKGIDLNEELVMNESTTAFYRMNGDALIEAGIYAGDVVVVDSSMRPAAGSFVHARVSGEEIVRRVSPQGYLQPANAKYTDIPNGFEVLGVVTCVIRPLIPMPFKF